MAERRLTATDVVVFVVAMLATLVWLALQWEQPSDEQIREKVTHEYVVCEQKVGVGAVPLVDAQGAVKCGRIEPVTVHG